MLLRGYRKLVLPGLVLVLLVAPSAAHAWYVDISITGAGRVYEITDADEIDEHCPAYAMEGFASPSTTPTGSLGASCRAGDASGDYGHGWVVSYVAEAAAGYRFAGWQSDGRTNPGPVLCDGSGGSSSYSGTTCQFATFANLQTRARFVDDTDPEMSSVTGPNEVVNGPATFTFSAAADPTLSHFECRVGGVHEWQTCSSGREENPASSGTYTFQVRAVDWSGNRSSESTWQWTVDKVAPETSLIAGPSGSVPSTSASFEFSSNESGGFICSLDGTEVDCGSPKAYTGLDQGEHTFTVRARDVAGNEDGSPASRTWTVDTVAPETTLASAGPSGTVASTSASFEFSSNESGSFVCSLDGAEVNCGSPKTYTGLSQGEHTFTVLARDAAGNEDSSPASRTWTVDTVAPETTLASSGPSGSTTATGAEFAFSSEPGVTFRCQLDGQPVEVGCTSPRAYSGLAVGNHTFKVWASDALGNADATPATRSWTVTSTDTGTGDDPGTGTGGSSGTGTTQSLTGETPDLAPPVAVLSFAKQRLRRVRKRGFAAVASTTEAGTLRLDVLYRGKRIASRKRAIGAAGAVKLAARLTKKGKRMLRRARTARLTVRLTVTDKAGNTVVKKKRVKLKR